MNKPKKIKQITRFIILVAILINIISALRFFRIYYHNYFIINEPLDDEPFFVTSLNYLINNGWYSSVSHGSSPVLNIIAYFFNLIIDSPLASLKIVSLLSCFVLIFVWYLFLVKDLNTTGLLKWLALSFLIQLGMMNNTYFRGLADALFIVFISWGFIALYRGIVATKSNNHFIWSGIAFSLALSVRPLLFIYLPGILLLLTIFFFYKPSSIKSVFIWIGFFGLTTFVVHIPSLIDNHKLSILDKERGPGNMTWTERRYLQISNHFEKGDNNLQDWDAVSEYKKKHSTRALPKSQFESIFKSLNLTVKNFIWIQTLTIKALIRKLGVMFFIPLFLFIISLYKKDYRTNFIWVPILFFFSYNIIFSFLMMNGLEFRWYLVFPWILSVFSISAIQNFKNYYYHLQGLLSLSMIIIGLMNLFNDNIW